jgi:hypothetical protein
MASFTKSANVAAGLLLSELFITPPIGISITACRPLLGDPATWVLFAVFVIAGWAEPPDKCELVPTNLKIIAVGVGGLVYPGFFPSTFQ